MKKISKIVFAVVVCVMAVCLTSCGKKEPGEYLYYELKGVGSDVVLVAHTDADCADFSERVKIQELKESAHFYCNKCVSDKTVENIKSTIQRNTEE